MSELITLVVDSAPVVVQQLDLSMSVAITFPDAPGRAGALVVESAQPLAAVQQGYTAQLNTVYLPGPPGVSEDDMVYAKRTDFFTDSIIYRGEAAVGALETAPVWRIRRLTLDAKGDVTEQWASGTAAFSFAWSDRLTLGYQ